MYNFLVGNMEHYLFAPGNSIDLVGRNNRAL